MDTGKVSLAKPAMFEYRLNHRAATKGSGRISRRWQLLTWARRRGVIPRASLLTATPAHATRQTRTRRHCYERMQPLHTCLISGQAIRESWSRSAYARFNGMHARSTLLMSDVFKGGNLNQMIDNSILDVYDIGSNAFVKQATQGSIMGPRMNHCAVRGKSDASTTVEHR